MSTIKTEGIVKSFGGYTALNGLDLSVEKGSVYGLIGPNGAGKTTIIKTLAGIYRPDSGTALILGENPYENQKIKGRSLYISDDPYFFGSYTIMDMARFYAALYPDWSWERFEKLGEAFKIETRRRPGRLSKGMKKQVAFWLAISAMPQVLLLDEPLDGLDPVMRRSVWSLLMQDVSERQLTVMVSSHNLRELEDVCDHVGIMAAGKIVLEKSLDDAKGSVHKLQLAFSGPFPEELVSRLKVLHRESLGSVVTLIANGEADEVLAAAREFSPAVCELLPLTLEELFIYELGPSGYNVADIII